MENFSKKTVILTAILSSLASLIFFVSLILTLDSISNESEPVTAVTKEEMEDSNSVLISTEIRDINNELTKDQLEYIRTEYLPKISNQLNYTTLSFFYSEDEDANYLILETTTESLGVITARFIEKSSTLQEIYIDELTHPFKGANMLLANELGNYNIKVQLHTKEMSENTFSKISGTEIEYFFLDYLEQ